VRFAKPEIFFVRIISKIPSAPLMVKTPGFLSGTKLARLARIITSES